ncbi:hypothetical protein [Nocardia puris]|nr:hypothetical protein [Nocardia puris]
MVLFTAAVQYPRGYLPSGIVLARAESGLYGPYDDSATDGRDLAAGFLWTAFTPSADREAAPLWVGVGLIQEDRLPPGHGLDESAKADLASWFKFF